MGTLWIRSRQTGVVEELNEAIEYGREPLALRPPGHPNRFKSLNNISHALRARGLTEDMGEVIEQRRESLTLIPLGHPDRAVALRKCAEAILQMECGVKELE